MHACILAHAQYACKHNTHTHMYACTHACTHIGLLVGRICLYACMRARCIGYIYVYMYLSRI